MKQSRAENARDGAADPGVGREGTDDDHDGRGEGAREGVRRTRAHHPRLRVHGDIVAEGRDERGLWSSPGYLPAMTLRQSVVGVPVAEPVARRARRRATARPW